MASSSKRIKIERRTLGRWDYRMRGKGLIASVSKPIAGPEALETEAIATHGPTLKALRHSLQIAGLN
jgi:hypothetical protein